MKFYILYIITALLTFWIILVLFGVSAGFANPVPVIALVGSLLLFTISSPLLIYNSRIGLFLGLAFLLMMLPFTLGFVILGIEDGVFNWGIIFSFLPALLVMLGLYLTTRQIIFQKDFIVNLPMSSITKIILAIIPIGLTLVYFIFYGRAWF